MVILSDGEGDEPRPDTIAAAKAAKDQGTRIITIMIGKSNAAKALMSEIASSPSDFHMMSSTKELAAIYKQLAVELSGCISSAINPSPTASATPEPSPAPTETLTPAPATPVASPAPTETPAMVVTPGATAMPTPALATPVVSPAPTEAAQTLATPTTVPITPTAPPSVSASTIPCVADTYINRDEPDTQHGNESVVKVSASVPERWALIRCQAPAQPLQHVTLRVYVAENSQDVVISKAESAWSEQTTWNSRPQIGAQVAFYANTTKGTWLDIDVTQAVQADGTISLVIQSHSTRDIEIATRERNGYGPQVVIR